MKVALLFATALLLAGCAADPAPTEVTPPAPPQAADLERIPEILASADAADGETDQVVTLCAGCALAMEGDATHALDVGEYTMHFCSGHCLDTFSEDTERKLLAMEVPVSAE